MSIGIWQIAIVVILVVLLFGRGKISSLMGDVAKGIKSFKKGMASDVTDDVGQKIFPTKTVDEIFSGEKFRRRFSDENI